MEIVRRPAYRGAFVSALFHCVAFLFLVVCWQPVDDELTIQLVTFATEVTEPVIFESPTVQVDDLQLDTSSESHAAPSLPTIAISSLARAGVAGADGNVAAGEASGQSGGSGSAAFFGTVAQGDHFVYIVDASTSMADADGRFLRAVRELLRSVGQLRADQYFYVFFFSSETRRIFDEEEAPHWLTATPDNKRRLRDWVATIEPSGGTHPQLALYLASRLQPSAVFLLSDGDFSRIPKRNRGTALAKSPLQVVDHPDWDNVPIHTIAFENP